MAKYKVEFTFDVPDELGSDVVADGLEGNYFSRVGKDFLHSQMIAMKYGHQELYESLIQKHEYWNKVELTYKCSKVEEKEAQ